MSNKKTLIDAKEKIAKIAREHHLRLVILYGSVARGTATATSDIDIGILGERLLSFEDEARIGEALARVTGLHQIEAKSLHHAAPLFLSQVMEGIVLYEDTPTRAQELSLYAWKLAAESKHLRDARFEQTRARVLSHV